MKKIKLFINEYKFYIINLFLIFYFTVNFFDGNRGYFSLQKKKVEFKELTQVEENLRKKNIILKNQNEALTKKIDLNFLNEIYKKNFVVGKKNEKLIIIK